MNINRLVSAFLLILLLLVEGCGARVQPTPATPTRQTEARLNVPRNGEAWEAYRNHDFKRVIELLQPKADQHRNHAGVNSLLGRVYYELNKFKESRKYWNRAIPLMNNPEQREHARKFRDRSQKLAEIGFSQTAYNHFEILIPPELSRADANRVNHQLERAYQAVGADLNTYPDRNITVILHLPGPYRRIMDGPIWSGGLFDGKIHIKYSDGEDVPYSRQTLVHEYTHALIHSHARNNVPLWFNEGLATFQEFRHTNEKFRYTLIDDHPPEKRIGDLAEISETFRRENSESRDDIRLAYEYSHSMMKFFEERYGLFLIQDLLRKTGETSDFEQALLQTINQNKQNLQFSWESWLAVNRRN